MDKERTKKEELKDWDDDDEKPLLYVNPGEAWYSTEDIFMKKYFGLCRYRMNHLRYLLPHRSVHDILRRAMELDLIKDEDEVEECE